jgi:hypothetical protein
MSVDFFTTELPIEQSSPVGSSPGRLVPVNYRLSEQQPSYTVTFSPAFHLQLRRGENYYTVTDERTGIFGQGEDASVAIRDFYSAVSEHLDVLERQPALSDELSWQLDYLRARVRR